jgi:hypothetical protein
MVEHLEHVGLSRCADLAIHPLPEVLLTLPPAASLVDLSIYQDTGPDDKPPTEVPQTMLRGVEWERRYVVGKDRVSDETACRMGVKRQHKEECLK